MMGAPQRFSWMLVVLSIAAGAASAQQVSIPRISAMPDIPSPYFMRDWKRVALGYDSFVYDLSRTGQYLPLIFRNENPVNYPMRSSFGLHTVVGTTVPGNSEAINVLPSLIGATLAGTDKSGQNGNNWVVMSQEFFNIRSEELVYLNNPVTNSGDDWWYDTMPNVFFYQLYWLYPGLGDSERQFRSVADRWLQALKSMGGSTAPWRVPNMDHRGWRLLTMTPNDVPWNYHEPEAAGALAWIFYNAWKSTGEHAYRSAAELSMEFLNGYPSNPAYELQLPYGAYIAARMNAELGTTYDVLKIVNWCFEVSPIRSWGAMVGRWGGYDVSGLIGEVNGSNDYPFLMNTFQQVGALVPLVRYDDRFARAVGKWVLNAANAARLFYPNFLPDQNQDSEEWSRLYDPEGYIGHEAMRQRQPGGTASPYATGDAIAGGWGRTNLALYGSSHVGILGAIADTTNVPGVLRLDLLKTDYFRDSAFATYLYFNPDSLPHTVAVEVGQAGSDLYDAISNSFTRRNAVGGVSIEIPSKEAVLLVLVPAGGTVTYEGMRMLVNGVTVDFRTEGTPGNSPPRLKGLGAAPETVYPSHAATLFATAVDPDGDSLSFTWSASAGAITGTGPQVTWTAPSMTGTYSVHCTVTDRKGGADSAHVPVAVVDSTGPPPRIIRMLAHPGKVDLSGTSALRCAAWDPSGHPLSYAWSASHGTIVGEDSTAVWTAPGSPGNYSVRCVVDNGHGGLAVDSLALAVRDLSVIQTGALVAYYPFSGNAEDESGFGNDGVVSGAVPVDDRLGHPAAAYAFNGASAWIRVANAPQLNVDSSITVAFWMRPTGFYAEREQYPISHGNWQNRWKVSISNPSNRLRWTVKTSSATRDLDSRTPLSLNTDYHVVCMYNGSDLELYLNGELDAFSPLTGKMAPTTYDLSLGRSLPAESGYSFRGVLDEVRIYNYGLPYQSVQDLFSSTTGMKDRDVVSLPATTALLQNYPNPFNGRTEVRSQMSEARHVKLAVYDLLGREVRVLVDEWRTAGTYRDTFSAEEVGRKVLASGVYICRMSAGSTVFTRRMLLLR